MPFDPARALEIVAQWIAGRHRSYVCLANVHGVMDVRGDPELRGRLWRRAAAIGAAPLRTRRAPSERWDAATVPRLTSGDQGGAIP